MCRGCDSIERHALVRIATAHTYLAKSDPVSFIMVILCSACECQICRSYCNYGNPGRLDLVHVKHEHVPRVRLSGTNG